MKFSSVGFLAIAASLLCLVSGDSAASSTRQLIRGGSSIHHDQGANKDWHLLEDEEDADEERELGRVKARKDGGSDSSSDSSSSKGSKSSKSGSSSSKGSKGSKSGSKGSKGGGGGGRRRRRSGPSCGAGCGDKDFAYIYLEGSYFFRDFNDDSVDVVPIEGTGRLNNTKDGSTIRILDQDLKGYAKYFDHGDYHPVKNDIHGSVSGSCTLLATYEGETTQLDSELCLAHCTICVAYEGQCCESSNPYEGEWGEPWGKESCESYRGYATITADLLFALEFVNGTGSPLISIPDGGLVSLDGLGPITGTALELNGASYGGVGYIEYDALDRNEGDVYKIGLQVPFNDRASCKLQDEFHGFDIPPPDTPRPPPARPPTDFPTLFAEISGCVQDNFGTPLSQVTIRLVQGGDDIVDETTTNAAGKYKFTDVDPGTYEIVELNPPSHPISVTDYDTTSDGDTSEDDTTGDDRIAVSVVGGEKDDGNDFIDAIQAAICGSVANNLDEPLAAVTLSLEQGGSVIETTLTDASGEYCFDVDPGDYVVVETNPDDFPISVSDFDTEPEDDDPNDVDTNVDDRIGVRVGLGEVDTGNDFVDAAQAAICGNVTSDIGAALPSVLISLEQDGSVIETTLTDDSGEYCFDVDPGDYFVIETNPVDFPIDVSDFDEEPEDDDPNDVDTNVDNSIGVSVGLGEVDTGNNFVDSEAIIEAPGSISGKVTLDSLDGAPLPGVLITLLDSGGEVVSTILTDTNGQYTFTNVPPGDYKLMEEDLAGYESVSDFDRSTGDNDQDGASASDLTVDNMIAVTLEAGEEDVDNDFVDRLSTTTTASPPIGTTTEPTSTGSISGKVTEDTLDGDPIPGVLITLLDSEENVVSTILTDTNGQYTFTNVPPGDYKLMEEDLAGYESVSDFDRSTGDNDQDGASASDMVVDNMIEVTLEAGEDDRDNDFVDTLATTSTSTSEPIGTTTEPGTTSSSPLPPCGTIKITEILYDPSGSSGGDKDGEWIEIFNNDCNATVDMDGWDVGNFNRRGNLQARRRGCQLKLGPNEYGVIVDSNAYNETADPKTFMTKFIDELEANGTCVYESPFVFIGNRLVDNPGDDPAGEDSGSDQVVISDENGLVVDRVNFDTASCGVPQQDVSLERITFTGASDCTNFARSTNGSGSTPGVQNSVFEEDECDCDLELLPPTPKDVIFTEINFAVPDLEQWIEVRNNDCCDIELDEWSVGDTSLAGGLTPCSGDDSGSTLPIGYTALFIPFNANCSDYESLENTKVFRIGNAENGNQIGSGLNANEERIYIYDSEGNIVDSVGYDCEGSERVNCGDGSETLDGTTLQRLDATDPNSFEVLSPSPGQDTDGFENAVVCTSTTRGPFLGPT